MKNWFVAHLRRIGLGQLSLLACLALMMGCASTDQGKPAAQTSKSNVPPLPPGVTLRPDQNIQGVWLEAGFDFKGYDALYVAPTEFAAIERPNEVDTRARAMRTVPEQFVEYFRDTKLFPTVTARSEELKPDAKNLKLTTTIIEYERGGGAARYFAGVFGAGQPVIKVRGLIFEGDKLLCVFEIKRTGESAQARLGGAGMSDEDIQRNDISVLARDLAAFCKRKAGVQ